MGQEDNGYEDKGNKPVRKPPDLAVPRQFLPADKDGLNNQHADPQGALDHWKPDLEIPPELHPR